MTHLLEEPISDPALLYRYRDSMAAIDVMAAAIAHLDFFTWLAEHPNTPGTIGTHFGLHPRPVDVMLTLFAAQGLVTQSGGIFHLTLRAREHLTAGSRFNLAPYFAAMKDRPSTVDMLKVLRMGKPANWGSYDTAAMDCRGILLGPALAKGLDLSRHRAVLDIAGGSGIYACALAARHTHLRATVLERPPVDRIARESIQKHGAAERVDVIAGDIFAGELPGGFDVHLWSNVLHDWEESTVRALLAKSCAALPADGLVVVHDSFLNGRKDGPLPVAEFSALLMKISEGRCYSVLEMRRFLDDAGFQSEDQKPTAVGRGFIIGRKA